MNIHYIYILTTLLTLEMWNTCSYAQKATSNEKLTGLGLMLGIKDYPKNDTIMPLYNVAKNKKVTFDHNQQGEISHIGLSLFSNETKSLLGTKVCNYIERSFLEYVLHKSKNEIEKHLKENKSTLTLNEIPFGKKGFDSFVTLLDSLTMPTYFSLEQETDRCYAHWVFDDNTKELIYSFPLNREIIEGTDKQESDKEFYDKMKYAQSGTVDFDNYILKDDSNLTFKNGIFTYHSDLNSVQGLSSDRYYLPREGQYYPLFNPEYPIHSLTNLFQNLIEKDNIIIHVQHSQYGGFSPVIDLPLNRFLKLMEDEFVTLCGASDIVKAETANIYALFKHKRLNYMHILKAHVNLKKVFENEKYIITADLFTNIPQDNIIKK